MALPTTGAISLSQVVAEFGGVAPHAMSEFYALLGKGVTGLPSSGVFNCSQFYGKSNQVITSVWTASGYNSTTNTSLGAYWGGVTSNALFHAGNSSSFTFYFAAGMPGRTSGTASGGTAYYYQSASYVWGAYTYTKGSQNWSSSSGTNRSFSVVVHQAATVWVDTSAYVNTTTTAQITT
jgi:hypothetical protein